LKRENPDIRLLIVDFLKDSLTSDEKWQILQWIGESPSNKAFFEEIRTIWLAQLSDSDFQKFDPKKGFGRFKLEIENQRPSGRYRIFKTPYLAWNSFLNHIRWRKG